MAMELQYLKAFYEVARHRSISGAATALRITQPALSRTIQNLEASLGKKLFARVPRGVTLTEDGRRVFDRCHRIFLECRAIEESVQQRERHWKIAASENLCLHVLPGIFAELSAQATERSLELLCGTAEEVTQAVLGGTADVGYCYHSARAPGLISSAVAEVEFWVVSARLRGAAKNWKTQPFIGSFARGYSGPYAAKSMLAEIGLPDTHAEIQSNSQEAQLALVEAGLGFSLVPWFLAAPRVKAGAITRIKSSRHLHTPLFRLLRTETDAEAFRKLDELIQQRVGRKN